MNKKLTSLLIGAIVVSAVAIGFNKTTVKQETEPITKTTSFEEPTLAETAQHTVRYTGREGVDAFTLLEENADIKYKEYDFGNFVTEINGVENDKEKVWLFYINGEMATVGADNYITKDTDLIEWRYEEMK